MTPYKCAGLGELVMVEGSDPPSGWTIVDDVLELDENTLIPNSTRRAAFDSHINEAIGRFIGGEATE